MSDLFGAGAPADDENFGGEVAAFPALKRGPGRPAGAKNRKSEAARRYYQARGFRDPLAYLGELVSADPLELARWLGAPLADVVSMQVRAAAELMPYLHGKMPIRVETDDEKALPVLIVDMGTDQVAVARAFKAGEAAMSIGDEQNQWVSDDEDDASHG